MRIVIIDDNINVIKFLGKIITDKKLGDVVDYALDGKEGIEKVNQLNPDIVLVDLLMPIKDGITVVKEVKKFDGKIQFIMLSQVSTKDIIGKAYEAGIEFFINKPINAIEVEKVIKILYENIIMKKKLLKIQKLFDNNTILDEEYNNTQNYLQNLKYIMQKIGIIGTVGSKEIIDIVLYLLENNKYMDNYTIKELCGKFTDNEKAMEQRIRRTVARGMNNIAHLGIEDYSNETFERFSIGLYNFEEIRKEMDYIKGKSKTRCKVNIKKFIDGLICYCERECR